MWTQTLLTKLVAIAQHGRRNPSQPRLHRLQPFKTFFLRTHLDRGAVDTIDDHATRRELLTRCLLLSAVVDQGPDITGVRLMTHAVINRLYRSGIRLLHNPTAFFTNLSTCVSAIIDEHEVVKRARATRWAEQNQTEPAKYNLFIDATQALNYAIARWGVPLALPLLIGQRKQGRQESPLVDYIESYRSAEMMTYGLKDNPLYGLGKAIGDKACHLFAKWFCSSFGLARNNTPAWGPFSFEIPFDSNAGRVLWRTGFFLKLANLEEYKEANVVQPGKGKGGTDYLRVTNIRGMQVSVSLPDDFKEAYTEICLRHLCTHRRRPTKVAIQRVASALMYSVYPKTKLAIAEVDDGLIDIGTRFCYNHNNPECPTCPIASVCDAALGNRQLITQYRT